jgi:hypothetical protein
MRRSTRRGGALQLGLGDAGQVPHNPPVVVSKVISITAR